ncbi:hypothetical protein [Marinobacter salsuginis]|jgi:hypothetical protein|uniref:Uncharacterized protein n=2 Tax=Marinobacter TaxID=2742 RepID=A0A5M3Q1I7_9GAMM|nr:hypothetical protein [Marinobacter salsuginis]GBO89125.1 hypothetical protein MSSD14B_27930 [Marinobacter salsuginis]
MSQAEKQIYRYRVKGDPRGWEYSSTPFMADSVTPGPMEDHQHLSLGQASAVLTSREGIPKHESESAVEAVFDVIPDTYIVMNENALGIVHGGAIREMDVLAGLVLKGGPNWKNGPVAFNPRIDRFRQATLADFETFRVSPKGHLM